MASQDLQTSNFVQSQADNEHQPYSELSNLVPTPQQDKQEKEQDIVHTQRLQNNVRKRMTKKAFFLLLITAITILILALIINETLPIGTKITLTLVFTAGFALVFLAEFEKLKNWYRQY